jgi:hypothetical protein
MKRLNMNSASYHPVPSMRSEDGLRSGCSSTATLTGQRQHSAQANPRILYGELWLIESANRVP